MWSYGRSPYPKVLVENVLNELQKGRRCDIPESTSLDNEMPTQIKQILSARSGTMWSLSPNERISIERVKQLIDNTA
jgi:hypothetical protein